MIRHLRFPPRDYAAAKLSIYRPAGSLRNASTWVDVISNPANKVQSYISGSDDPFLNLSFEHFLLEKSPAHSSVLLLYVNRPCIVIGRNQNPWLETNLSLLNSVHGESMQNEAQHPYGKIDLVRRKSGGGTVFHDAGNVNWTVISPSEGFTRDKHAEMIVRALRENGIVRSRVNERHDIVLDQSPHKTGTPDSSDYHRTRFTDETQETIPLKVSGSAYKLTRGRALHHGTCLLNSKSLSFLHDYLTSPARPYITAKGVESVRSPVANVGITRENFERSVQTEFSKLYGNPLMSADTILVSADVLENTNVCSMYEELQSPEWKYDQTPQFSFSTRNKEWERASKKLGLPELCALDLRFRQGIITEVLDFTCSSSASKLSQENPRIDLLMGRKLRDAWTWREVLEIDGLHASDKDTLAFWLQRVLPTNLT